MNRDHTPIVIEDVNGLYDRSTFDDSTPENHLTVADNLVYSQRGFGTRSGTSLVNSVGSILRFVRYKRLDEVSRFLILSTGGNLYDSTNLGVPILTLPSMVDFSAVQYYNRIYISPHNRIRGIENEYVYVYDGTTCRKAGGTVPSGTLIAANSALSGNVDAGTHLFAISFESSSGHITRPGPALYGVVLADGTHQIDISGIPIGPVGTVARRILATRRIPDYAGNQNNYIFYFVPTGRIANNSATTATVNFFDGDLLTEADYLFDELSDIPAGIGIGVYSESLITWGEYNNPSVVRISKQGDPESFSAISGYITIAPNDAGGVMNASEFRDSLYIMKGTRTYVTTRDTVNSDSPIFWRITNVDEGIGTGPFGIASVLDTGGPNTDSLIVAARVGLMIFNGLFMQPELTWKISSLWQSMNYANFNSIQVFNDVVTQRIYTLMPDSTILVGDYKNGLSFQSIRWARWTFPWTITSIGLDINTSNANALLLIAGNGNLWKLNTASVNDDVNGISTKVRYAPRALSTYGEIVGVSSVRFRLKGSGILDVRLYGLDNAVSKTLQSITLDTAPGKEYTRLSNFKNEKCAIELELNSASEFVEVLKTTLFVAPVWMERPNVT